MIFWKLVNRLCWPPNYQIICVCSCVINVYTCIIYVCTCIIYVYGWPSRFVRPIWKVKRAPKRAYPSFRRFSCAIAHLFLGDPDSDVKNAKFFRGRPSRPCLCIRMAITAFPTHLEGQTSPKASIRLISTIFVCYSTDHFLGDPDTEVKNSKFFCGRPSRPCLCIRLAITAFPTHLEGQTSPEASIRLILTIFEWNSTPFFEWSRSEHTPHFDDFRVL